MDNIVDFLLALTMAHRHVQKFRPTFIDIHIHTNTHVYILQYTYAASHTLTNNTLTLINMYAHTLKMYKVYKPLEK